MARRRQCIFAAVSVAALALVGAGAAVTITSHPAPDVVVSREHPFHGRLGGPGGLGTDGTALTLHGAPHQFVGINAPMAASTYALGLGCGDQIDPTALFAAVPPDAIVRVWFTQYLATNHMTDVRDWSSFDRVVSAAELAPSHPHLVVTLANQSGDCDSGVWRGRSWYEAGWDRDPDGTLPQTYGNFVRDTVTRYKDSTAVGAWEPVNEPESSDCAAGYQTGQCFGHLSCGPGAATALRGFFDGVGATIRAIDVRRPISTGSLGGDQCGWGADSDIPNSSAFVDIVSYHDYSTSVGVTNELARRLAEAKRLDKPLLIGESGLAGRDVPDCLSTSTRAQEFGTKMTSAFDDGAGGYVLWVYGAKGPAGCDLYILPDDPVWHVLGISDGSRADGSVGATQRAIRQR
jgi:mannan endo-1,4-beta-mannosidase